ncbi:hypothetical protein [Moheibacter sediminis]|uniref:Uncharacterized protein n=1 Tax=Moheibacter sediminis TaxID=1434700 RepID=A0A1W1ZLK4_9FLAO|nr:hypothetical protein [Moheibacter sediminis]SMC48968.1 hypothetical protein SAMN06296427_10333 [Moheibacter sediminis]
MKNLTILLLLSIILFSCNKKFTSIYTVSTEHPDAILYSDGLVKYKNFKEGKIINFDFLSSCRKDNLEIYFVQKASKPCALHINKSLSDLIFMAGNPLFDSIVKAEFMEEKMINDSLSFLILKAETKNSKGFFAGNSEHMKILAIKSGSNLKSISKIYSSWTDGFHSYENSILKLNENLYQMNDYDFAPPVNNILNGYSIFHITNDGFIEVLDEKFALPYRQQVFDNVNNLNSK